MPDTLLDPVQPPEAVQLDAFVDCQLSVTACPTSIWVWLADTETETFFAELLVEVLAGAVTGVLAALDALPGVEVLAAAVAGGLAALDVPPEVELDGAAALEVVAGVLLAAMPSVPVVRAGAAELPEPPPPPQAA